MCSGRYLLSLLPMLMNSPQTRSLCRTHYHSLIGEGGHGISIGMIGTSERSLTAKKETNYLSSYYIESNKISATFTAKDISKHDQTNRPTPQSKQPRGRHSRYRCKHNRNTQFTQQASIALRFTPKRPYGHNTCCVRKGVDIGPWYIHPTTITPHQS